jgi:hypothetical protein
MYEVDNMKTDQTKFFAWSSAGSIQVLVFMSYLTNGSGLIEVWRGEVWGKILTMELRKKSENNPG